MKFKFGKLKLETMVMGIFLAAVLKLILPSILMYAAPVMSFQALPFFMAMTNILFSVILIWLLCEALYLILKASMIFIHKNSNEE